MADALEGIGLPYAKDNKKSRLIRWEWATVKRRSITGQKG